MNRLILFLIGIVLVGIAGFMAIWFGAGRELQGPSVAFLMECKDGRFQDVYDGAAPSFREGRTVDQLQDQWLHWQKEHGVFGEVLRRMGAETAPEGGLWDQMLSLELGFMNGHVLGRFYFKTIKGTPGIVHVWLATKPKADVAVGDRSSLEDSARTLFDDFGASDFAALHDGFAPALQMKLTPKRLHDSMGALLVTAGPLRTATLTKSEDDGTRRVNQQWKLVFEQATLDFQVTHEHVRGQWWVTDFLLR